MHTILNVVEHNCEAYLFRLHKNNEGNFIPLSRLLLFLSFLPRSTLAVFLSVRSHSLNQTLTFTGTVPFVMCITFSTLVFIYLSNAFEESFTYTY